MWYIRYKNGDILHFNPNHDPSNGQFTNNPYSKQGIKNIRNSKHSNLEKWGKDEDHNVLYITGQSGSGKSTAAFGMKGKNVKVIHLDVFTYPYPGPGGKKWRDREFVKFLNKKFPTWEKEIIKDRDLSSKKYWKSVDRFNEVINQYGKDQYKKNKRVIVEGIHIYNKWLNDSLESYKDKPIILLKTNSMLSSVRALNRDGMLKDTLTDLKEIKERIKWYTESKKELSDLETVTNAKKGKKFVDNYLKSLSN